MKIHTASRGLALAAPATTYAQRAVAAAKQGQSFSLVGGHTATIVSKHASTGTCVVKTGTHTVVMTQADFAALPIISPAMRRLASLVRRAALLDKQIDSYVKEAIRREGLPVDESMNWTKYLQKVYGPLLARITPDSDIANDAVIDTIATELYTKKMLSKSSPYAHFNPDHAALAGKPLESKVTAFLIYLFKTAKEDVVDYARRQVGVGAKGSIGLLPAESSTAQPDQEGGQKPDPYDSGHVNPDIAELEGHDEVEAFLRDFMEYTTRNQGANSARVMNFISLKFISGVGPDEVRKLVIDNPDFPVRNGKLIDRFAWLYVLKLWMRTIQEFASDEDSGWSGSSLGHMIQDEAKRFATDDGKGSAPTKAKEPKKVTRASSLHLADVQENGQPVLPNGQPAQPAPVVSPPRPPAPPNPNVQQQNTVKQQNGTTVPPTTNPNDPNAAAPVVPGKPGTIEPEIPGVNHTASEDTMSSTDQKQPAGKKLGRRVITVADKPTKRATAPIVDSQVKWAQLRTIAATEPREIEDAFRHIANDLAAIPTKISALLANLDLQAPRLTASIREKMASRSKYAQALVRLAQDQPTQMSEAMNQLYTALDQSITDLETLATNLNISLVAPMDVVDEGSVLGLPEMPEAFPIESPTAIPIEPPAVM